MREPPEMRRAASAKGSPDRSPISTVDNGTDLAGRQARRLAQIYALTAEMAAAIAALAYAGCPR
jgi:hypothetical protein